MGGEWKQNKSWSDKYLPEIKQILGLHFIGEAPLEEDAQNNTDLIVLKLDPLRFACRVRKSDYLQRFGDEFTVRQKVPSGNKTELTKIIEGWGDYMFYGFADETKLASWKIGSLNVFRLWFAKQLAKNCGRMPGKVLSNKDYSSDFVAFRWDELPKDFVIAEYDSLSFS